ncbi:MAG: glycosyltransferase [Chloroflexi bacterium]|nr:glycosyltransferase [Chloroflexota bacterium]
MSLRVLVVTLLYKPDGGPSAPLYAMLCEELARRGHAVTVIAAVPHYPSGAVPPEFSGPWISRRQENGVTVIRVAVPSADRSRLWVRLIQFACYQLGAAWAGLREPYDVVLAGNPALEIFLPFALLSTLRRKPAVFSVHDVYPDVGVRLGIFKQPAVIKAVAALERFCLSRSAQVRILSESFAPGLRALGVPDSKLTLIYDWGDTELIQPLPRDNPFAREHGLSDCFVALYAGNLGLSQGLENVLAAAERLAAHPDIRFVFVGEGSARRELMGLVEQRQLHNVVFIPFQPRDRLPEVLATADVSLVVLRRGIGAESLPSKVFSALASGRPLIASVDEDSPAWRLVERAQAGVCLPPEDPARLADAVLALKQDAARREQLGQNSRAYALEHHSPHSAAEAFEKLLAAAARVDFRFPIFDFRLTVKNQKSKILREGALTTNPIENEPAVENIARCPICEAKAFTVWMDDGKPTRYVRCQNCRTVYAAPRAPAARRFASLDQTFGLGETAFENAALRRATLASEAAIIQRVVRSGRLLDVGCDLGDFFLSFPDPLWQRFGVELSPSAAAYAAERHAAEVRPGTIHQAAYPDQFFDLVTMIDMLYYLDKPQADLKEVARVLKPGGFLGIEVPGQAYQLLRSRGILCWLLERQWTRLRTDSAYLFWPNPLGLLRLLRRSGFRMVGWYAMPSPTQPNSVQKVLSSLYFNTIMRLARRSVGVMTLVPKYLCIAQLEPQPLVAAHPATDNSKRVVLLSSRKSTYGAQVLRAAQKAGLPITAVIVEETVSRGGWKRFGLYLKRYGAIAVVFRTIEHRISEIGRKFKGERPLETIEQAAAATGVALENVSSLNSAEAHDHIRRWRPSLALLGGTRILNAKTIDLLPLGILNSHPGLLPKYRGNYCNRWALLNNDDCGVSVYQLEAGLDTGPMLAKQVVCRERGEWCTNFERRITALGAEFVAVTAEQYLSGQVRPVEQVLTEGQMYGLMPIFTNLRLYYRLWAEDRRRQQPEQK